MTRLPALMIVLMCSIIAMADQSVHTVVDLPVPDASDESSADAAATDSDSGAARPSAEIVMFAKPSFRSIRDQLTEWMSAAAVDSRQQQAVSERWADNSRLAALSGEELLDLLMESFAAIDPAASRLWTEGNSAGPVEAVVFDGVRELPLFRNQVQLFRGRWLVQHRFYDDALPVLTELQPDGVVDPAGLLFYRAVCRAELLQRREALDDLALLLKSTLDVPNRFRLVAELLQQDLAGRSDEGMDQVAQLMRDVERRLDLGRSGQPTQDQEEAVIAALDKLLEDMDQQKKQQNSGGDGGSQQNEAGTQGANQSQIKGGASEGEADRKLLKETGKWGLLNPEAEAKARELIRQQFPSNFLDQIGRYTKKLAEQRK
ncbi:MAG: hypothetical protein R3C49_03265 [Planctomycetaceae bacterium]